MLFFTLNSMLAFYVVMIINRDDSIESAIYTDVRLPHAMHEPSRMVACAPSSFMKSHSSRSCGLEGAHPKYLLIKSEFTL